MAKRSGFLGYNSLLGDGSVLTNYTPTLGERLTDAVRRMMFSDDREGQRRAERVADVLQFTPVGVATDLYDAGREAGAGNLGTAGVMLGMAGLPGPSPKKGIRAFHGSPHSFDRFDMSKIGTGEGAQAYGHGLYFAENEGVARGYRDTLSGSMNSGAQWRLEKAGFDIDKAIADVRSRIDKYRANDESSYADAIEEDLRGLLKFKETGQWTPGSVYEVRINASPDDFLDWDKPLSEHSAATQNALKKFNIEHQSEIKYFVEPQQRAGKTYYAVRNKMGGEIGGSIDQKNAEDIAARYNSESESYNPTGEDILDAIAMRERGSTYGLASNMASEAEASRKLAEAGIPGIKYLDAGSRGVGEGTRNYVVFDDRLIEIVRKYGIAGASAMLGYNLLDGMDQAQAAELKRIEAGK